MGSKKTLVVLAVGVVLLGLLGRAGGAEAQPQYRLGGAFIGSDGAGHVWSAYQTPLDPAGQRAALRVKSMVYGNDSGFAMLLAAFGADAATEFVGEEEMTGRDTARFRTVAFATSQGFQRQAIVVMAGTIKFTGPNNITVKYRLDIYLPSADADLDGYPDPEAQAYLSLPFAPAEYVVEYGKRVPLK